MSSILIFDFHCFYGARVQIHQNLLFIQHGRYTGYCGVGKMQASAIKILWIKDYLQVKIFCYLVVTLPPTQHHHTHYSRNCGINLNMVENTQLKKSSFGTASWRLGGVHITSTRQQYLNAASYHGSFLTPSFFLVICSAG